MPNKRDWQKRAVCPECGWHTYAPFGDIFHVHVTCCPECGRGKYNGHALVRAYNTIMEWKIKTMRWIPTSKTFRPLTWGDGHWEEKEEKEA